jgi:hypothetical protein
MKIYNFEQYSPEWNAKHIGIPTSSCFDQILTPKTLVPSASRKRYMYQLVAERLMNAPMESIEGSDWMKRGLELEPTAAKAFEFENDLETEKVGFVTSDNGRVGCSPDRFVKGTHIPLEIKAPSPPVQVQYLSGDYGEAYRLQKQGQIWLCEEDHGFFFSYNPFFPHVNVRTDRDDAVIEKLDAALDQFCDECDALYQRLYALGYYQEYKKTPTIAEVELGNILAAG